MTAFVSSFSEFVTLFFQALKLSSLLPVFMYVTVNVAVILPGIKDTLPGRLYFGLDSNAQALIILSAIGVVTYFLNLLNFSIIRWFEGYPLLEWPLTRAGDWLKEMHVQHYQELITRRDTLEDELDGLRQQYSSLRPDVPQYRKKEMEYIAILTELVSLYPSESGRIAPTRLGNAIASAEDYPSVMYGMDAVALWPRLVPTLTEVGYAKFVEREKNALDFMLNSLVLLISLGVELGIVGVLNSQPFPLLAAQLLGIAVVSLIFYRLSVDAASGWGTTIRTSFDLYRDNLRKALRIQQPQSFGDEIDNWTTASRFYGYRNQDLGNRFLDYSTAALQKDGTEATSKSGNGD